MGFLLVTGAGQQWAVEELGLVWLRGIPGVTDGLISPIRNASSPWALWNVSL